MTAETATKVVQYLKACYPNDAWKLDGKAGGNTAGLMHRLFQKYPDDLVMKAVLAVTEESEQLPSLVTIRKTIKQMMNAVPEYKPEPQALESAIVNGRIKDIIEAARERAKDHQRQQKEGFGLDPNIIAYARTKFPGISERQIYDNLREFTAAWESNEQVEGNPIRLKMDPGTGIVYTVVFYRTKKR